MTSAVALHEAGHCVIGWALGFRDAGPVTIVPSTTFGGMCHLGRPPSYPEADVAGMNRPWPLVPARLRRFYESDIMASLAGDIAVMIFGRAVGLAPAPARRPGVALPERDATMIASARERTSLPPSDDDWVEKALWLLHGPRAESRGAHRLMLESETKELLKSHAGRLVALAQELDAAGTLSSRQWSALLNQAGVAATSDQKARP